jgi:hypothetical protein
MEPAKPATLDPGLDGVGADTGIEQLARRYRAMLPPRQRYDRLIEPRRGYAARRLTRNPALRERIPASCTLQCRR